MDQFELGYIQGVIDGKADAVDLEAARKEAFPGSKREFARIFDVDGRQVLFWVEHGPDDGPRLHKVAYVGEVAMADLMVDFAIREDAPDGPEDRDVNLEVLQKFATAEEAQRFVDDHIVTAEAWLAVEPTGEAN